MSAQLSSPDPQPAAFLVGRDPEGHWVALETHGSGGGLFLSREAAAEYAEFETGHRPGAVLFTEVPIPLAFS